MMFTTTENNPDTGLFTQRACCFLAHDFLARANKMPIITRSVASEREAIQETVTRALKFDVESKVNRKLLTLEHAESVR